MTLCLRQGWSLREAKQKVSPREFMLWRVFLAEEVNHFHRIDYYLAQIAAMLSSKKTAKDFILKFEAKKPQKPGPITPEERKRRAEQSKAAWFPAAGLDAEGKFVGKGRKPINPGVLRKRAAQERMRKDKK